MKMRTYIDCIPCFFGQALRAARMAGMAEEDIWSLLLDVAAAVRDFAPTDPPPKFGKFVYGLVRRRSGVDDPFAEAKRRHTKLALAALDFVYEFISHSDDKLDSALLVSAAGNVLDFGAHKGVVDLEETLERVLSTEQALWQLDALRERLRKAQKVLVVGDNAGEAVFDRVLLEVLGELFPAASLFYAVRGGAVINDATRKDAEAAGIDKVAKLVDTGSDAPGILMDEVSEDFARIFRCADVVIAKGQGNYETLDGIGREVFFVMTVKCEVVSGHVGVPKGEVVLFRGGLSEQ